MSSPDPTGQTSTPSRAPGEEMVLTHFIVSEDVERSRRFYTDVLGGKVVFSGPGGLTYVALANSWIIINVGGGPTDDKPTVTLEAPRQLDRVSSFLNIRVKDIAAVYAEWSGRGARFLTPPKQHQYEIRCYLRDPDGHLIEVGQTTDPAGDWSPPYWRSSTSHGRAVEMVLTHFIVSDDVGRSRRFYGEVLRGKVVFSPAPTNVALANSWIVMNAGGGPTDDKPSVTLEAPRDVDRVEQLPQYPGQRHRGGVCRMERPRCSIPDAAEAAPVRDPLLHPRSRRSPDRGGTNHGPGRGLVAPGVAVEDTGRGVRVKSARGGGTARLPSI